MEKIKSWSNRSGRIGKVHIENISVRIPSAEVVAVADRFLKELKKWQNRFGIKTVSADYNEIIIQQGS